MLREIVRLGICFLFIPTFAPNCASRNVCEKQHSCHKWQKKYARQSAKYVQKTTGKSKRKRINKKSKTRVRKKTNDEV
jgi:hypothetical protein